MASIPLGDLPAGPRTAWTELTRRLERILGDDLVAVWAHGGSVVVADEPHAGDLDTYVIVAGAPDGQQVESIQAAHDAIANDRGVTWDVWYVLDADARGADPPRHAFRAESRDTSWAIHRAHWLAGRSVVLHGPAPHEVVMTPTRNELEAELSRELEHIERHVLEGDTDPYEASYALLNGSRILHAVESGSVVLSKAAAGAWALERLPARWHPVLGAANRAYFGRATTEDEELLAAEMAPFVAFVRDRSSLRDDREPGALPRWSGA